MTVTNVLPLPGAVRRHDGTVEWNVWAPVTDHVELLLHRSDEEECLSMQSRNDWFSCRLAGIADGTRYRFRVNGHAWPDPASRWQPEGVHADSAVFTPQTFSWTDQGWAGIPREDLVIYELHIGTFTSAGTFAAVIERLPDLVSLGVTAIEIMPIAQFPGSRNWGYDGVSPYAVQNSYGGPRAFQQLVDAAHQAGLAVILDVVYNHLGPEGNYLSQFGPYFTSAYQTPWGQAINYDGPGSDPVRRYMIENACMWVRDFHVDGLRLDAVHAIFDLGPRPILAELAEEVQAVAQAESRSVHLIAESDQNNPRLVDPVSSGGMGLDAVWADDFHHSVLTWLTGERTGYFADFGTAEQIAKAYEDVFVYDGIESTCRQRRHGAPVGARDRTRFVVSVQNHDQVGNRGLGDRPSTRLPRSALRLMCGLLCISPALPLLFMGEEYGETNPFPFFCSFTDADLVQAVRQGRRKEFADLGFQWADSIPDPHAESTFQSARLCWQWEPGSPQAQLRQLYQDLLKWRRTDAGLRDRQQTRAEFAADSHGEAACPALFVRRGAQAFIAVINLNRTAIELKDLPDDLRKSKFQFSTEFSCYGGARTSRHLFHQLLPFEMQFYGRSEHGETHCDS